MQDKTCMLTIYKSHETEGFFKKNPYTRDIMIHKFLQVVKRHIRSFYVEVQSQCLNCELCLCLSDPICIIDLNHKSLTKHVCLSQQTILQQLMNHFLRINLICNSFKIITPLHSNPLLTLDSPETSTRTVAILEMVKTQPKR